MIGFGDLSQIERMSLQDKAGLSSIIDAFPGNTLRDKLASGHAQARAILAKYTSTLSYDHSAAEELFHQIETWQNTHPATIAEMMKRPATDTLPEQVALVFSPQKAQAFLVAGFSEASKGLGPWLGGMVGKKIFSDSRLPEARAKDDANARLAVFASIVKLEKEGSLQEIFHPMETWTKNVSGFGALPIAPFIPMIVKGLVVIVVAAMALFVVYRLMSDQAQFNNQLFGEYCDEAKRAGDAETMRWCAEMAAPSSWERTAQTIGLYAVAGVVAYAALFQLLPMVWKKKPVTS